MAKTPSRESAASSYDGGAILRKKIFISTLVSIFLIGGIVLLYIFLPVINEKTGTEAIIKIPAYASREIVNDTLTKYFGEKFADKVILVSKIRGNDFSNRHGAYLIEKGMSPLKAERKLSNGAQQPFNIVVNNARGINILADKVSSKLDFSSDSLIRQVSDFEYVNEYGLIPENALALFIDDTYQFYWTSSPKAVLDKIGTNYKKIWNEERLGKASKLGLTPAEVITIASIVDEETNKADEKTLVARLYLNRLKKGMKLQADPTVKFALGDFSLKRIRNEHLKVESPYNTYMVNGLPPGPIRTVTVKDIDAVLNAPYHDYIYMCAKEDFSGYHNFAKDYATHQTNARKYQRALNKRNIK